MNNPCLSCGACCCHFRVSFYWGLTDAVTPGGIPHEMTEDLTPFRRYMKGTNDVKPRCVALEGTVGEHASCTIHPLRPQPCRDFNASYFDGFTQDERCDQARERVGLKPLTPKDWL